MSRKNILDCTDEQAKRFFLQDSQFCNFDLPPYFSFKKLLKEVDLSLPDGLLSKYPSKRTESVNYSLLSNKNGRYNWRPLELIHPVLYVELVNVITKPQNWKFIKNRINKFNRDAPLITCTSWPAINITKKQEQRAAQINEWWEDMQQQSIKLGLEYNHLFKADISNCYGSLYTHAIAWALHTRQTAKKNHKDTLLGNRIDNCIQAMRYGETNGIPQGSVLMDFVAELVLKYIDSELANKLGKRIGQYRILRYRDDYNIFVNTPNDGREILKSLSEVLADVKMQLNDEKILETEDVITGVIKPDKLELLNVPMFMVKMATDSKSSSLENANNFQKTILQIYNFSKKYPNSGSIPRVLTEIRKRADKMPVPEKFKEPSISILANMIEKNPRFIPNILSLISSLSESSSEADKKRIVDSVITKLKAIPNTGYLDLYLQRMTYSIYKKAYDEKLTKVVSNSKYQKDIWQSDWLDNLGNDGKKLKKIVGNEPIIITSKLKKITWETPIWETEIYSERIWETSP